MRISREDLVNFLVKHSFPRREDTYRKLIVETPLHKTPCENYANWHATAAMLDLITAIGFWDPEK